MNIINLPFFGNVKIDRNLVEQDYQVFERFNETLIEINLIFETENLTLADLSIVKHFLNEITKHIKNSKDSILKNYNENEELKNFIQMHINALTPLGLEVLKELMPKKMKLEEYFLNDLELCKIYIFPDDQDEFIKLIYEISEEITDEKLFVRYGKDLLLKEIATEY